MSAATDQSQSGSDLSLFDDGQDVFFAHQQQFVVAELERVAGVGAEQHPVADLDLQRRAACRLPAAGRRRR